MITLYNSYLKEIARTLRTNMTESEHLMWSIVRGKKLLGKQFYRQKPLGPYIVDFYCPEAKLVIEIDGAYHLKEDCRKQDQFRNEYLQSMGLKILRFKNEQIKNMRHQVIKQIIEKTKAVRN